VKIKLLLNKTIEENAEIYFNKAKKLKKKIPGAEKAIGQTKKKLESAKLVVEEAPKKLQKIIKKKRKWFEKFHWFVTSNGFLVIAGRDATTNEDVIKKHANAEDLILHTDMSGSPFAVIKKNSVPESEISKIDLEESANFILAYSKAWKAGFGNADIFYVKPEQVTKEANSGEYLPKGAFMIRGKTNYIENEIDFCIGIYSLPDEYKGAIFTGSEISAKKYCETYFKIIPGRQKTSDIAKSLKKKLNSENDLDEFVRAVPPSSELKK